MSAGAMTGKTCVVTGGTAGIGAEMAVALARQGAQVAIIGRSPEKAKKVTARIRAEGGEVESFLTDLAELDQVRDLADGLLDRYERIDVLANNAGLSARHASVTGDGFDLMMAANHLGPFLLTNLLLDRIVKSAPARIIMTSSESHRHAGRIRLEKAAPERSRGLVGLFAEYGATKLLNILVAQELAERLTNKGVTANAFCPGRVASDFSREDPNFARMERAMVRVKLTLVPEQGARLGVKLATDPSLADTTGRFFSTTPGMNLIPATPRSRNAELRKFVWNRSAELVGL